MASAGHVRVCTTGGGSPLLTIQQYSSNSIVPLPFRSTALSKWFSFTSLTCSAAVYAVERDGLTWGCGMLENGTSHTAATFAPVKDFTYLYAQRPQQDLDLLAGEVAGVVHVQQGEVLLEFLQVPVVEHQQQLKHRGAGQWSR
jgi:hypothetical protein